MATEQIVEFEIDETTAGQRLDKFLAAAMVGFSRSQIQALVRNGCVTVLGTAEKPSYRLAPGDIVVARVSQGPRVQLVPEPIPLDIVYEDEDIVVVNKPAGMVVHPAPGHETGTLVNALLAHSPAIARWAAKVGDGAGRPGIVHRLDKDTSGLVLVAKHEGALEFLQAQFRDRKVEKTYVALVEGRLSPPRGIIEAPIGRDPRHRQRMTIVQRGGRPARTVYNLIRYVEEASLVFVQPVTGRTHQIRVHFAAIKHPVVGDRVYGHRRQRVAMGRQFLHAWKIVVALPTGERREFIAPLPDDLCEVLVKLAGEMPPELLSLSRSSGEEACDDSTAHRTGNRQAG